MTPAIAGVSRVGGAARGAVERAPNLAAGFGLRVVTWVINTGGFGSTSPFVLVRLSARRTGT